MLGAIIAILVVSCFILWLLWHIAVGDPTFVAAGVGEWLLMFVEDKERGAITCWFEPVVAYKLINKATAPVPYCREQTMNKINDPSKDPWVQAYWLRDGLLFDMDGSSSGDFLETLQSWYLHFKSVEFHDGVPGRYAELVRSASR